MGVQYPKINGYAAASQDVEFSVGSSSSNLQRFFGLKSLNFKSAVARGKVMGTGGKKKAVTLGTFDPTGDMELYYDDAQDFENLVGTARGIPVLNATFYVSVVVSSDNGDGNPVVTTWELVGCKITDYTHYALGEGPEALSTKYSMDIMDILKNGQSVFQEAATLSS